MTKRYRGEKTCNLFPGDLIQVNGNNHLILLEEKLVRKFPELPPDEKYFFMDTVTNEILEEYSHEFKLNSVQHWITTVYRGRELMRFHPLRFGRLRK